MTDQVIYQKIKELHKYGLKGVLDIVFKHHTFKKRPFIIAAIVSLAFLLSLCIFSPNNFYNVLNITSELITSIFPGLLGFSLGGYAIAVGFSNNDLIKYSTNAQKHNLYQILSGIFALSILIQAIATIIGFIVTWGVKVNLNTLFDLHFSGIIPNVFNGIILLVLFITSLYSLLLIPYIITNLFTLSQLNSLHFTLEKINDEIKNDSK